MYYKGIIIMFLEISYIFKTEFNHDQTHSILSNKPNNILRIKYEIYLMHL